MHSLENFISELSNEHDYTICVVICCYKRGCMTTQKHVHAAEHRSTLPVVSSRSRLMSVLQGPINSWDRLPFLTHVKYGKAALPSYESVPTYAGKYRGMPGGHSSVLQGETAQYYRGRLLSITGGDCAVLQGETTQYYRGRLLSITGGDSSIVQGEPPQ